MKVKERFCTELSKVLADMEKDGSSEWGSRSRNNHILNKLEHVGYVFEYHDPELKVNRLLETARDCGFPVIGVTIFPLHS